MDPVPMPQQNNQKKNEQININVPPENAFKSDFQSQKNIDARPKSPTPFPSNNPVTGTKIPDTAVQAPNSLSGALPPTPGEISGKPFKMMMAGTIIFLTIILIAGVFIFRKGNIGLQPTNSPAPSASVTPAPTVDMNLDSDKDGIPDIVEAAIGTNPNNADTDGDGYSDLAEIKNGYSPFKAGLSGKYTPEQWQAVKDSIKAADAGFYESVLGAIPINSTPNPAITPTPGQTPLSFICGTSTVKDADNNNYNTVKISTQCWLKENLKVTKNPAGVAIIRYCYGNDINICNTDGGLYDWNTTMNNSITEGTQGICPVGWHIPKDSEWYTLENGLKDSGQTCDASRGGLDVRLRDGSEWGCGQAGTKIKLGGSSGFNVLFSGNYDVENLSFNLRGTDSGLWSSTKVAGSVPWARYFNLNFTTVERALLKETSGFSVRCIKD